MTREKLKKEFDKYIEKKYGYINSESYYDERIEWLEKKIIEMDKNINFLFDSIIADLSTIKNMIKNLDYIIFDKVRK